MDKQAAYIWKDSTNKPLLWTIPEELLHFFFLASSLALLNIEAYLQYLPFWIHKEPKKKT